MAEKVWKCWAVPRQQRIWLADGSWWWRWRHARTVAVGCIWFASLLFWRTVFLVKSQHGIANILLLDFQGRTWHWSERHLLQAEMRFVPASPAWLQSPDRSWQSRLLGTVDCCSLVFNGVFVRSASGEWELFRHLVKKAANTHWIILHKFTPKTWN